MTRPKFLLFNLLHCNKFHNSASKNLQIEKQKTFIAQVNGQSKLFLKNIYTIM